MHNGRMLTAVCMPVYIINKRGKDYNILSARVFAFLRIRLQYENANRNHGF